MTGADDDWGSLDELAGKPAQPAMGVMTVTGFRKQEIEGKTILIVDDNPEHLTQARRTLRVLEALGVTIITVPVKREEDPFIKICEKYLLGDDTTRKNVGLILLDYDLGSPRVNDVVRDSGLSLRDRLVTTRNILGHDKFFYVDMRSGVGNFLDAAVLPDGMILSKRMPGDAQVGHAYTRLATVDQDRAVRAGGLETNTLILEDTSAQSDLEQFAGAVNTHLLGHCRRSYEGAGEAGFESDQLSTDRFVYTVSKTDLAMADAYSARANGVSFRAVASQLLVLMSGLETKSMGHLTYHAHFVVGDLSSAHNRFTPQPGDLTVTLVTRGEPDLVQRTYDEVRPAELQQFRQAAAEHNARVGETARSVVGNSYVSVEGNQLTVQVNYARAFETPMSSSD
jgi:hypothetical protein